ncbi:HlyC/CorC family transporter [bacterium]|nr:HlyC/CorC family transporter [bacterium]
MIALLTLLNGFFSLSEIALLSVKPSRIQTLVDRGEPRAQTILLLLSEPERFLSSVQVGITLIGIFSGAFGGATITGDVQYWLERAGMAPGPAHSAALLMVIGAITYFTIVVGELVPKSIALSNPEKIALISAPLMAMFTRVSYPAVKVLSVTTHVILKFLRVRDRTEDRLSAEELRSIIRTANMQGVLDREESQAHHNLLRFSEEMASTLMTQRGQVEWIDSTRPLAEILGQVKSSVRSKYPVGRGSLDDIEGTLNVRDLLEKADAPDFQLSGVVRPAILIPEGVPAFSILQLFKKNKQYIALVMDEHGQFEGLVTLHDLTEAIVGDLPGEDEEDGPEIVQRHDGSWLVSGRTHISDLNAHLERILIVENPVRYTTVAGYFLTKLEQIPQAGSRVSDPQFDGEVMDMDGHRIDMVLITPKSQPALSLSKA